MGRSKLAPTSKRDLPDEDDDSSQSRPKRRATNAHIFRYLQTGNPGRLQDRDLRRALEASLEECPDFWPAEDTASCSSSDQSNGPSSGASTSSSITNTTGAGCNTITGSCTSCAATNSKKNRRTSLSALSGKQDLKSVMRNNNNANDCNCYCFRHPATMIPQCPVHAQKRPKVSVHNRYKPVAKKNIYHEADFFHEGIMSYIEYELQQHCDDQFAHKSK